MSSRDLTPAVTDADREAATSASLDPRSDDLLFSSGQARVFVDVVAEAIARARAEEREALTQLRDAAEEEGYLRGLRAGAASEREEVARMTDRESHSSGAQGYSGGPKYVDMTKLAAAIRARGERFPLSGADAPSEGGKA